MRCRAVEYGATSRRRVRPFARLKPAASYPGPFSRTGDGSVPQNPHPSFYRPVRVEPGAVGRPGGTTKRADIRRRGPPSRCRGGPSGAARRAGSVDHARPGSAGQRWSLTADDSDNGRRDRRPTRRLHRVLGGPACRSAAAGGSARPTHRGTAMAAGRRDNPPRASRHRTRPLDRIRSHAGTAGRRLRPGSGTRCSSRTRCRRCWCGCRGRSWSGTRPARHCGDPAQASRADRHWRAATLRWASSEPR